MEADTYSVNKNYITNQTVTIHWSIIAPLSNFIFQNNKHVYKYVLQNNCNIVESGIKHHNPINININIKYHTSLPDPLNVFY
jgi:hypothetical protein